MPPRVLRSDRLRQLRESFGLTQLQLAERTGISLNQINRYENGISDPLPYQLKTLAKELEATTDYLLGLVDQRNGHLTPQELTADERKFLAALREGNLRVLLRLLDETIPEDHKEPHVPGV